MQISARVHYACLAMLELAARYDQERPLSIREIVARHPIPQPFLVQILQSLRSSGLVSSTRGSSGGYRLSIPPDQVSIADIADAIGCGESNCAAVESNEGSPEQEAVRTIWLRADEAAREVLTQTRLSDLVRICAQSSAAMFYI